MNNSMKVTNAKSKVGYSFYVTAFLFVLCFAPAIVRAQSDELKIPAEIQSFIGEKDHALALETADLNGDGTTDFILVTEPKTATTNGEDQESERTLMIITRDSSGKLKLVKTNKQVVYCKSCGGAFGDPFDSIEAKRNGFAVYNYGGSAWRWGEHYWFNYSRIDKTWQLVRVEQISYNSLDPEKTTKTKILTPKKFGKIDIADFDIEKLH